MAGLARTRSFIFGTRSPGRIVSAFIAVMAVAMVLILATVASVLALRIVPPTHTPLMMIRAADGDPLRPRRRWVSYQRISPHIVRAVIAAEDARFCTHKGFDWTEIKRALEDYGEGDRLRGASTISNQTAKNLFLWPGRNFVRKGLEAYFTVLIEALWSKRRIVEVYLNVAEWGRGVYGVEAAARRYFGRSARNLTPYQAALLAAALPNPRRRSPARPSAYMHGRAARIQRKMYSIMIGGDGPCLRNR